MPSSHFFGIWLVNVNVNVNEARAWIINYKTISIGCILRIHRDRRSKDYFWNAQLISVENEFTGIDPWLNLEEFEKT